MPGDLVGLPPPRLEHVEQASERRVEDHRDGAGAAHGASRLVLSWFGWKDPEGEKKKEEQAGD